MDNGLFLEKRTGILMPRNKMYWKSTSNLHKKERVCCPTVNISCKLLIFRNFFTKDFGFAVWIVSFWLYSLIHFGKMKAFLICTCLYAVWKSAYRGALRHRKEQPDWGLQVQMSGWWSAHTFVLGHNWGSHSTISHLSWLTEPDSVHLGFEAPLNLRLETVSHRDLSSKSAVLSLGPSRCTAV